MKFELELIAGSFTIFPHSGCGIVENNQNRAPCCNDLSAKQKRKVLMLKNNRGMKFELELIAGSFTIFPRSGSGIVENKHNRAPYLVEVKQRITGSALKFR